VVLARVRAIDRIGGVTDHRGRSQGRDGIAMGLLVMLLLGSGVHGA
jgi:hypothetical protein